MRHSQSQNHPTMDVYRLVPLLYKSKTCPSPQSHGPKGRKKGDQREEGNGRPCWDSYILRRYTKPYHRRIEVNLLDLVRIISDAGNDLFLPHGHRKPDSNKALFSWRLLLRCHQRRPSSAVLHVYLWSHDIWHWKWLSLFCYLYKWKTAFMHGN